MLLFYVILIIASALGALATVISLFVIRSRRNTLFVILGALLALGISAVNVLLCLWAYALTGVNMSG